MKTSGARVSSWIRVAAPPTTEPAQRAGGTGLTGRTAHPQSGHVRLAGIGADVDAEGHVHPREGVLRIYPGGGHRGGGERVSVATDQWQ